MPSQKIHFTGGTNLLQGKHAHDCVVLFYANWCGFCKSFMPIYDEVADVRRNLPMYKIDLAKEKDGATYAELLKQETGIASSQYGIADLAKLVEGYPTTILFLKGKWLQANVSKKHPDGTFNVDIPGVSTFDNQVLPAEWIRPKQEAYKEGDVVECYRTHIRFVGGKSKAELLQILNTVYGPTTMTSK